METVGTIMEKEETIIEWLIPDFLSLSEEHGASYFSPLFLFHKAAWCIQLSPIRVKNNSHRQMRLYLHRKTSGLPIKIEFSFQTKKAKCYDYPYQYSKHVFSKIDDYCSIVLITPNFLLDKKSDVLPSDALTLLCFLKHPQSTESSDNLLQTNSESIRLLSESNLASSNLKTIGKINEREEFLVQWSLPFGERISYFSPIFSFENISWCIEVYPGGDMKKKLDEYIHVYLHKKSSGPPIRIEYTFGYKDLFTYICTNYLTGVFNETECDDGTQELLTRTAFLIKKAILPYNHMILICRIKRPPFIEISGKEATLKSSKIVHVDKLLQDFKELFLKKTDSDVVLKVREQEFLAHKYILAARSPVFESTFRNDMKEKETGIVDIEDCDSSSFSDFLCFIYCGEIETLSEENVFSLFTTSDKYDVQDLRKICMVFMKKNISVDTFCDTITLALQHSEMELIRLATEFFIENYLKIVETVPWQKFAAENPTQSNELVTKALEAGESSDE